MFFNLFFDLIIEVLPFFVLGSLLSAMIEVYLPQSLMMRFVPQNKWLAMLLTPFLGLLFPVCECVVVVVIRRLIKKGLPLQIALPYMLSSTVINPVVIASTYVAFQKDWTVVTWRLVGAYVISILAAQLLYLFTKNENPLKFDETQAPAVNCACGENDQDLREQNSHHHGQTQTVVVEGEKNKKLESNQVIENKKLKNLRLFIHIFLNDFVGIGKYLLMGVTLSALVNSFVHRDILNSVGQSGIWANLIMIGLAFLLSICSEADAFVATSFTSFSFSSKIAFLVFGPMLDLKLVFMYQALFKPKVAGLLMGFIFILVFIYSTLLGIFINS